MKRKFSDISSGRTDDENLGYVLFRGLKLHLKEELCCTFGTQVRSRRLPNGTLVAKFRDENLESHILTQGQDKLQFYHHQDGNKVEIGECELQSDGEYRLKVFSRGTSELLHDSGYNQEEFIRCLNCCSINFKSAVSDAFEGCASHKPVDWIPDVKVATSLSKTEKCPQCNGPSSKFIKLCGITHKCSCGMFVDIYSESEDLVDVLICQNVHCGQYHSINYEFEKGKYQLTLNDLKFQSRDVTNRAHSIDSCLSLAKIPRVLREIIVSYVCPVPGDFFPMPPSQTTTNESNNQLSRTLFCSALPRDEENPFEHLWKTGFVATSQTMTKDCSHRESCHTDENGKIEFVDQCWGGCYAMRVVDVFEAGNSRVALGFAYVQATPWSVSNFSVAFFSRHTEQV